MEQFDPFPIQCTHIEHMHEGVWFRNNNFWQNDSCENLDNFSLIMLFVYAWLYPPQTLFVVCILFSRCPSVRNVCFLYNSKSHCWIFIKPCKHVHICKTNTLDKKVRVSVRPSVTFCFLNNSKSHLLDFHQTLQTCSYMQDKYFRQKSKG